MENNELISNSNNSMDFRNFEIKDIYNIKEYLFIEFSNGQKILTNGTEVYNVSEQGNPINIFKIGNKLCAVLKKSFTPYVVDLKTNEILFKDTKAYFVSKQDEVTLHVIMSRSDENNTLYNIETRQYLPVPKEYEFETSLGNGMYVFRKKHDSDKSFYDYKRCVITASGQIILKDIEGYISFTGTHLVISKKDEMSIVGENENSTIDMKTIAKNEKIIATPQNYDGNIIIIEKNYIKIFSPSFELLKEIKVDGLEEVLDLEIVDDTLKLLLPYTVDGEKIGRHAFVNLKSGKIISHLRIEGYPYWTPTTYIGQDSLDSEIIDYYFYNSDFELIINVPANYYKALGDDRECMFYLYTASADKTRKQLLNMETGSIKEVEYDYIHYHHTLPYGYGTNLEGEKIDFFNKYLDIVVPGFDYKKYNIDYNYRNFGYFIVNNYVCVTKHIVDGYGKSQYRYIIQSSNGDIILDSILHRCYQIGNYIHIVKNGESKFLDTITGKIECLSLALPTDEFGRIDFSKLASFNSILEIGNNNSLMLSSGSRVETKTKKLEP